MAEVVFQNLEEQLPVLEELEKEGVFTSEELRVIIRRRTDFEYKLQKRITEKKDILNYLEYERKLDLLRKKRSARLKLKPYNVASRGITKKIHTLFRQGLMKFSDDLNLWLQYVKFCKDTGSARAVGLAFGKLLQQHAGKPDLWIMAAKYEIEELNNVENARLLFQKGLRINKTSKDLWQECFRLELLHVDKIKKRRKIIMEGGLEVKGDEDEEEPEPENIEDFLRNITAQIVFENAMKEISNDAEFALNFLTICEEFDDAGELEEFISTKLQCDFPQNEMINEFQCVRPLRKLKKQFLSKDSDWFKVEVEVKSNFDKALLTTKSSGMYEKYSNCFVQLMQESTTQEQMARRLQVVLNILETCEEDNLMNEVLYLNWTDILTQMGDNEKSLQCIQKALLAHPKSFPLWENFLLAKMGAGEGWEAMLKHFGQAISSVEPDQVCDVWKLLVETSVDVCGSEEIESVYEQAINSQQTRVKEMFLGKYLHWVLEEKGLDEAREFYSKHLNGCKDKSFFDSCIDIEASQSEVSVEQLRGLHEKAVGEFGETSCDVWLNYISFEKQHAPENFDVVGQLYIKAKKVLKGKLNADFISKYTLM